MSGSAKGWDLSYVLSSWPCLKVQINPRKEGSGGSSRTKVISAYVEHFLHCRQLVGNCLGFVQKTFGFRREAGLLRNSAGQSCRTTPQMDFWCGHTALLWPSESMSTLRRR